MPQDFYSLEEAANRLNLPKDQLLEMARKGDLRAFLDRGTQRFRKNEIEELGRKMGLGSDPELQPRSGQGGSDIFGFDPLAGGESSSSSHIHATGASKKPGSDSDVRLVAQGSDIELQSQKPQVSKPSSSVSSKVKLDSDSDVKLVQDDSAVPIGREKPGAGLESGVRLEGSSGRLLDSGVRLVDDRLRRGAPGDSGLVTEELDLDAELRQAEKSAKPSSSKKNVAPFELSQDKSASKDKPAAKSKPTPSSSEFELKPTDPNEPSDSVFDSSSEQIRLDPEDDSSIHVSASRDSNIGPASGLNLHKPNDKGISLEDSSGETLALDLSDDAGKKPKGKKAAKAEADSSSEFELTLDDDIGLAPMDEDKGSKDVFKTNLGKPGKSPGGESSDISLQPAGSDEFAETSDFELALDEDSSALEGETGSEVIVIDEDAGEADATALRPDELEADDVGEILESPDEELAVEAAADDEVSPAGRRQMVAVEAPPAEWGISGAVHLLTLIFLIPTGFLLFEMLRSIWGYNQESPAAGTMFDLISKMMK